MDIKFNSDIKVLGKIVPSAHGIQGYATREEMEQQIQQANKLKRKIVTELPTGANIDNNTIYMILVNDSTSVYNEYLYNTETGVFNLMGNTALDLTDYIKYEDLGNMLEALRVIRNIQLELIGGDLE